MKLKRTVAVAIFLACGGCQVYSAVSLSPASASTPVRVTLTDRGAAQLYDLLGTSPREVNGTIIAVTDTTLTLGVTSVTRFSGSDDPWKGERVTIPRADVASVDRRSTSVARSLLVAAGIVGGAYIATRGGTGDQVGSPIGGPPATGH